MAIHRKSQKRSRRNFSYVRSRFTLAVLLAIGLSAASLSAQDPPPTPQLIVGNNSNMLGGEQILRLNPFEVRGDVLGRADNEGSCAASTRKPDNYLCAGNTYRMVDVPGVNATSVTRDAWQGIYQSSNGGDTWESTLHPGFFLDPRPHIFKALDFRAAADATVRSGVAGMAWHSGIAFKSDKSVNSIFVSTFADVGNRENDTMPFKYVRTTLVDLKRAPNFIDKPWMYVEAAPPGQTCTIVVPTGDDGGTPFSESTPWGKLFNKWLSKHWPWWVPKNIVVQHVQASIIHVVYSVFLTEDESKADLMYSKSTNCGLTFSVPKKISTVQEPANGATIGKALVNGSQRVFAAWRRVNVPPMTAPNAILAAVSNNNGSSWSPPTTVAAICAFEQGTTPNSFRTTAFPTMTVDASGRAYVAWSDRGRLPSGECDPNGAGRVMVSTSTDGANWSQPQVAVPSSTGEQQIMPSLAFTAGKVFLAWVDFKEDVSGVFGRFVDEANLFLNGLPVNPPARRHTGDVRLAVADPGAAPNLGDEVARVSKYLMGRTPSIAPSVPGESVQLQWNAMNRRWARRTEVPFVGDYIDIATRPYLPPDLRANPPRPDWTPNNGQVPVTPTVLLAWTDNRDMRDIPPSQLNPNGSVPFAVPANVPGVLELPSGKSIVDSTQNRTVCQIPGDVYKTGTTNQNLYAARAVVGLATSTPSGNKVLGAVPRTFVVYVRNDTDLAKTFRLQIPAQPPGGIASFDQFTVVTVVDLNIPRHSSVARTVFVRKDATPTPLDPRASVRVDVIELAGGSAVASDSIYLNADRSAPEIDSPEIDSREIFLPEIDSPEIDSLGVSGPEIDSPEIDSPEIDSETLKSLGLQAPEIDSPEIDSPEIDSNEIATPEIDSPEIDSAPITDVKFRVTNTGNTTAQYNAKSLVKGLNAGSFNYQLIVRRKYNLRAVGTDCLPTTVPVSKVLVNLLNVNPQSPEIDSPEIDSSAPSAAAFYLAPGETGEVIVRARKVNLSAPNLTINEVGIATQQKAVDSDQAARGITEPPVITSFLSVATAALPAGVTGTPYSQQLIASGGTSPYTWTITQGTLPPGLTFSTAGLISGTPTTPGVSPFTVQVKDSSNPQNIATRALSITITQAGQASLALVTQPTNTVFGQVISPQVSVRAINGNGSAAAGITITMAIGTNPGGGTLSGTLTAVTGVTGIAVFPTLSIDKTGNGYTLVASAFAFTPATAVAFNITTSTSAGVTVYDNQIAFLSATGATNATGPLPSLGSVNGGATVGNVTFSLAPGGDTLDIGGPVDWYPGLPGNDIALGFENLKVSFPTPVTAMGFRFVEPRLTMPPYGGTPVDSTFIVTLFNGTVEVGNFSFNAPDDQLAFVGVSSATPFTSATIIDTTGNDDDEYFGEFYTSFGGVNAFVVTNTADGGPGSMRQAMLDSAATPIPDTIIFDIPGPAPYSIGLSSPLPAIGAGSGPVSIDATTQAGFAGTPIVEINGNSVAGDGLNLSASGSAVRGLMINRFGTNGIGVYNASSLAIFGNWIGLAPDGATPSGNGGAGIEISASAGNVIGGQVPLARNVIAGNTQEGVRLDGTPSTNNVIVGNYIGTNAAGGGAVGNLMEGVFVGAGNNTIGGLTGVPGTGLGNVISGHSTDGIVIGGPGLSVAGTIIQGNIIGLDASGTVDITSGVGIRTFNAGMQVGGAAAGARNVISGNQTGVSFSNSGSTYNSFIEGNYIGTDITGTLDRGNSFGVAVGSAPGVRVGGSALGSGNVISGNQTGVFISNTNQQVIGGLYSALVQSNLIGLDATGTNALANTTGVLITGGHVLVGGTATSARNVISGNLQHGVSISNAAASDNLVQGNFIGTDVSGTLDRGNGLSGVSIINSPNNTVGGTVAGAGNLLSGNDQDGVEIGGSQALGNTVQGNFIGTDVTGTVALGNTLRGVSNSGINTVIGGVAPGARNILSGNQIGIRLGFGIGNKTTAATVQGNLIGTDVTGTVAMGNQWGIFVNGGDDNVIGGAGAARNVISGNTIRGISLHNLAANGNQIRGNYIGTDITGNVAIANTQGVVVEAGSTNTVIGGTGSGDGNVISGNALDGVVIFGSTTTSNVVAGNKVGSNAAGSTALGNHGNGIHVIDSPNNIIGGSTTGSGNFVVANSGEGVRIDGAPATGNLVQGNIIGIENLGNSASGVFIRRAPGNSVSGNNITFNLGFAGVAICGNVNGFCGGGDAGTQGNNGDGNSVQGNYINGNQGIGVSLDGVANSLVGTQAGNNITENHNNGVLIFGAGASGNQISSNALNSNTNAGIGIVGTGNTGNRVQSNSFISNTTLAIDLGGNGVTPNDGGDIDVGPNNFQNFPDITSATTASVQGTLNSTPNTTFSVQLYQSITACSASGQGETLLATFNVITNGNGSGSFVQTGLPVIAGQYVMATATDPAGNTSEFSGCVQVDQFIPNPVLAFTGTEPNGQFTNYLLTVTNSTAYPDSLFLAAPNLPPCGLNPNSSRTWVDVFADGVRVYGFCALESAAGLNSLFFPRSVSLPLPNVVYITLTDRQTGNIYTSNNVTITPLPAPVQISPADGSVFGNFPRTTTLTWAAVPGAVSYVIEREFCSPAGCNVSTSPYPPVTGWTTTSFTFDFVGAQPGRWRVRAVDVAGTEGAVSPWWNFRYTI